MVTLTTNYTETLKAETVDNIEEWCVEGDFELSDALIFIDEHDEDTFNTYYPDYIEQGEKLGYNVVDAFVQENGFCDVEHCEEAYAGTFRDTDEFVEDLMENMGDTVPDYVIVDLQATWDRSLSYDYDAVDIGGGMHFFRRYY